jgi:DNA-binding NarL/FixJ family response regulator
MGLSNQEIASHLCIAVHTVKNHVHSVLTKLDARSRGEAVARFRAIRGAELSAM